MAMIDFQYHNDKDNRLYSDGTLEEEEMLRRAKEGQVAPDSNDNFVYFYHFSPLRENILNWYPFKRHSKVLEIGAGCGAVTVKIKSASQTVIQLALSKKYRNCDCLGIFIHD